MEITRILLLWEMTKVVYQVAAATDSYKYSPQESPSLVNDTSCFMWLNFSSGRKGQMFSGSNEREFWAALLLENSDLAYWMRAAESEKSYLLEIRNMSDSVECPPYWETQLQDKLDSLTYITTSIRTSILFRKYLDPIVYTVMATVGLFGNGAMLLIIATNSEMHKGPNLLLANLVVGDMLNLAINLPVFYVRYYISIGEAACYIFITLRAMFVASSALSVAVLSLHRYRACINWSVAESHEYMYIAAVWLTSLIIAIPYSFAIQYENGNCFRCRNQLVSTGIASLEYFLYCILLPVVVTVLLYLAALSMKNSIPHNPYYELQKDRSRSATTLICLIGIFLVSYCPHHTWRLVFYWLQLDIWDYRYRCLDKVTYYLVFANPCLNPFALIVMSSNFRKCLVAYYDRLPWRNVAHGD